MNYFRPQMFKNYERIFYTISKFNQLPRKKQTSKKKFNSIISRYYWFNFLYSLPFLFLILIGISPIYPFFDTLLVHDYTTILKYGGPSWLKIPFPVLLLLFLLGLCTTFHSFVFLFIRQSFLPEDIGTPKLERYDEEGMWIEDSFYADIVNQHIFQHLQKYLSKQNFEIARWLIDQPAIANIIINAICNNIPHKNVKNTIWLHFSAKEMRQLSRLTLLTSPNDNHITWKTIRSHIDKTVWAKMFSSMSTQDLTDHVVTLNLLTISNKDVQNLVLSKYFKTIFVRHDIDHPVYSLRLANFIKDLLKKDFEIFDILSELNIDIQKDYKESKTASHKTVTSQLPPPTVRLFSDANLKGAILGLTSEVLEKLMSSALEYLNYLQKNPNSKNITNSLYESTGSMSISQWLLKKNFKTGGSKKNPPILMPNPFLVVRWLRHCIDLWSSHKTFREQQPEDMKALQQITLS